MKFGNHWLEQLLRGLFLGILALFLGVFLRTILYGIQLGEWGCWAVLLCLPFLYMLPAVCVMTAPGELAEEGVYVRRFFRKRFHSWSDIRQALLLKNRGKGGSEYNLLLVTKNGTPRKPGDADQLFLLKNQFRLIYLPDDEETIAYVTAHHGPLACDQRQGMWEM